MFHAVCSSDRSSSGRLCRPGARTARRWLLAGVSLVLLLAAWLPAPLAAQAPDGNVPDEAASPQAAIWSGYPIYGGNMTALASDPANNQVFYVGTETAGVYKTTDAGTTWQPARTGLPSTAEVISLAVDPQNSNAIYAGTDAAGIIWKSADAGATWRDITHNMPSGTFADAREAYNIIVDPHDSSTIYLGLGGYAGRIYKSIDGGGAWWAMDAGIPRDRETYIGVVTALAIDPDNALVLYAGVRNYGVYKTSDGGATWTPLNEGVPSYRDQYKGVTALTVDTLHSNRPVGVIDGQYYVCGTDNKWSQVSTGYGVADSYGHAHLRLHPTNPKVLYAAASVIKKSADGGVNWTTVSDASGPFPDMAFHRSTPNILLAANQRGWGGNVGGVRKSLNGGTNWIDASTGIAAQTIQGIAIDPQNPNYLYAGSASGYAGVWRSTDRGVTWKYTSVDGQVQDIAVDPLDSMKVYVAADYYFMISGDRGVTFTRVEEVRASCLAVTPGASNPVYAGGGNGVYKTTDGGLTWLPKRNGFPTTSSGDPAEVMSLAVDPNNPAIIWAGTEREGIVKSTNGGDAWQVKGFVDVPDVDAVAVRPGSSNTILVGTGDYRGTAGRTGEIHKSTDGGQTWQLKYRGKSTITDFVYDPRNPNWVYAGTGYLPNYGGEGGEGVLRSLDGGEHWASYSSGLFNQVVFSLAISAEDPPLLLAGTMGSGLYGTQPPRLRPVFLPLVLR